MRTARKYEVWEEREDEAACEIRMGEIENCSKVIKRATRLVRKHDEQLWFIGVEKALMNQGPNLPPLL